jgi:hypothetical protein
MIRLQGDPVLDFRRRAALQTPLSAVDSGLSLACAFTRSPCHEPLLRSTPAMASCTVPTTEHKPLIQTQSRVDSFLSPLLAPNVPTAAWFQSISDGRILKPSSRLSSLNQYHQPQWHCGEAFPPSDAADARSRPAHTVPAECSAELSTKHDETDASAMQVHPPGG